MNLFFFHQYSVIVAPSVDHRYCEYHQPTTLTSKDETAMLTHQINQENKEETLDKFALTGYTV